MKYLYLIFFVVILISSFSYSQNYSLSFDGASNVVITSQVASVSNNFTMELWAKPTARDSVVLEGGNQQNTYRMAITPPHGDYNWGAGHAGVGIAIGTNQVTVLEHATNYLIASLVWEGNILHGHI